jgi:hypothetical protein
LLSVTAATAQQGPPKPGPEHQKLGYYVGKWTSETELKANPFMPAGKYTTVDDCQLFQGGFAVLCRSQGTSPLGPTAAVGIMGYSAEDKVYTYYGIDNNGMVPTTVAKGTIQGDTWTFNDESKFGGKLIKSRYSIKQLSPTSYSFRWEVQGDDGNWTAMMEGKSTKAP